MSEHDHKPHEPKRWNALDDKDTNALTIPADSTTTSTLALGQTLFSAIETAGDQDWYAVTLTTGQTYSFVMEGAIAPDASTALNDSYLTLYDADSNAVMIDDDGGEGLFSNLVFTAETSGTYYIAARHFDTGTGGYSLSMSTAPPPILTETLNGDETPTFNDGFLDVYFASAGEVFDDQTSLGWNTHERTQALAALSHYSTFINLGFRATSDLASADAVVVTVDTIGGGGTLGYFTEPSGDEPAVGVFARGEFGWTEGGEGGLAQGGYGWVTLIHEFGHALGLAHPHDNGGGTPILQGVTDSSDSGAFNLNQGIFTTMSYVDGWRTNPDGTTAREDFGWQGTAGALDIAVLQEKFGANTTANNGDDVYVLPDANAAGTYFTAIWDTAGEDTIAAPANSNTKVTINLNDATLQYEEGGGGFVSWMTDVSGGFTIANGVEIENATGGEGDDTLVGNDLNNRLIGLGGDNVIDGGLGIDTIDYTAETTPVFVQLDWGWTGHGALTAGVWTDQDQLANVENVDGSAQNDVLIGANGANIINGGDGADWIEDVGDGDDTLNGGAGDDVILGASGADTIDGGNDNDGIRGGAGNDNLSGGAGVDWIYGGLNDDIIDGGAGDDVLFGGDSDPATAAQDGSDQIFGRDGNDTLIGEGGSDALNGGAGDDWAYGGDGVDTLNGEDGVDSLHGEAGADTIFGGSGDDFIFGGAGLDVLLGQDGRDWIEAGADGAQITGGQGADSLFGGGGSTFIYTDVSESTESVTDVIGLFVRADGDKVDVSAIDADGDAANGDTAFTFVSDFTGVAGEAIISVNGNDTIARFDVDGDSASDLSIVFSGFTITTDDFIL